MIRAKENPILTRESIPPIPPSLVDVSSVFNPGAVRFKDKVMLMLRVQNRGRETFLLTAESRDGIRFDVSREPVRFQGLERVREKIHHVYDPRITRLDDAFYILFAMDMEGGCRLGLGRTEDFVSFTFQGIVSGEDARNGVLFPQKWGDRYLRLDRPNRVALAGGPLTGDTIYLSESRDLLDWSPVGPLIAGRPHYFDELIGPGPPPIKTRKGWVCIYHGVATHLSHSPIYQAGVLLLDLDDPGKVLGRSRYNILEPREIYELTGQVPNVVFPSGAVVEGADDQGLAGPDAVVTIYYGAADTCVCAASSTVSKLIDSALES